MIKQENVPLPFIQKLIEITKRIKKRINQDIYRGIILEVSQGILSEQLNPIYETIAPQVEILLLIHSNIFVVRRDFLTDENLTRTLPNKNDDPLDNTGAD